MKYDWPIIVLLFMYIPLTIILVSIGGLADIVAAVFTGFIVWLLYMLLRGRKKSPLIVSEKDPDYYQWVPPER